MKRIGMLLALIMSIEAVMRIHLNISNVHAPRKRINGTPVLPGGQPTGQYRTRVPQEGKEMRPVLTYVSLFGIMLCVALTGIQAEALLIDMVDPDTGDHVVFDDQSGTYWIWDMTMFTSQTYDEQVAHIGGFQYFGIQDWRMAGMTDMQFLWAYAPIEIGQKFHPTFAIVDSWSEVCGRYDVPADPYPGHGPYHLTYIINYANIPPYWVNSLHIPFHDLEATPHLGAWVVANAQSGVIPEPTTLLLFGIGLIGLLAQRRKASRHQ
jgi:hypothetical protein